MPFPGPTGATMPLLPGEPAAPVDRPGTGKAVDPPAPFEADGNAGSSPCGPVSRAPRSEADPVTEDAGLALAADARSPPVARGLGTRYRAVSQPSTATARRSPTERRASQWVRLNNCIMRLRRATRQKRHRPRSFVQGVGVALGAFGQDDRASVDAFQQHTVVQ